MNLFSEDKDYKLYQGNMLDMLEVIEPNSIDSIITDPPYELNFMGKGWDNSGIAFQTDTWKRCYEVLKSGGYLLAFGGSRTFHRIACAIEDAGFEIRDTIMWLYGSGFPKSMNIGLAIDKKKDGEYEIKQAQNEWQGWGTALKPSFEPIIVARKPFKGSLVDNVIEYGVGGINIDECRVENTNLDNYDLEKRQVSKATGSDDDGHFLDQLHNQDAKHGVTDLGRFPANTILTYDEIPSDERLRYFYCAKASKKDRDEGLDEFKEKNGVDITGRKENTNGLIWDGGKYAYGNAFAGAGSPKKNTHPTVKPTELMQYLVRLVTPNNGVVLDPFNGSGSTGKAVMYENKERGKNYKYIGIEITKEYLPIAKARIEYVCKPKELRKGQLSMFDYEGGENEIRDIENGQ